VLATQQLIDLLEKHGPGDELADAELQKVCGKDTRPFVIVDELTGAHVAGDGYGNLQSAVRDILRRTGRRWERLPGKDRIRCLTAEEVVLRMTSDRKRVRRLATKNMRAARAVSLEDIPEARRRQYLGQVAVYGALMQATAPKTTKLLEKQENQSAEPDKRKLLEAIIGRPLTSDS